MQPSESMRDPANAGGISSSVSQQQLSDWTAMARVRAIPPPFSDHCSEREFLDEYRLAGLTSVAYACVLGILAYVAIGVVHVALGGWDPEATLRRLIAVALLTCAAVLIVAQPSRVLRNYCVVLGSLGVVVFVGLVSVIHLLRDEDARELVNPVSLLSLWILYGFVRLPIRLAIAVGLVGALFSMFGSRLTNMSDPALRSFIYLLMGNALGVLLARSIEVRERYLFLQRRVAETAQIELQGRTIDAENASAEKTRLIAAVGHDLRQPMLSAVLHSEVLRQRLRAGDIAAVERQADRVEQSVKVLGDTLEHLLTAARYESGTEPVRIRPVRVSRLFRQLRDLSCSQALARGISLRIREPADGLIVLTDEHALLRILMNLVSNAIKFTPPQEDGKCGVVVRASLGAGICRIVVADTGVGIAKENMAAIWEPFFQVGNEERNRKNGLGLGLYLVRQTVSRLEQHSVVMRSTIGRGTRVDLRMPGALGEALVAAPPFVEMSSADSDMGQNNSGLAGLHVVLIEDDQEAREAIETQLAEWGITCSSGVDVEQVMDLCAERQMPVDRIIADFRLPGQLDGTEVIRAIRDMIGYDAPAVLVTAEVDRELILGLLPPKTVYIPKPFDAASLNSGLHA